MMNASQNRTVWSQNQPFLNQSVHIIQHMFYHCCLVSKTCPIFAIKWTVAHQAALSVGFSRQEYWSGLPFPPPGDLPNPGIEPTSPAQQAVSCSTGRSFTTEPPGVNPYIILSEVKIYMYKYLSTQNLVGTHRYQPNVNKSNATSMSINSET